MTIRRWSSCARNKVRSCDPNSLLETVSRGQDPLAVDQGASAGVAPALVQTGLPGPSSRRSVRTPHNPGVEWCSSANWTQMTKNSCFTEDQRLKLAASNKEGAVSLVTCTLI